MVPAKLVSAKECVERFYTDTGTQDFINSDDVKLWIVEVYDMIGYPLQYLRKVIGHKQDPAYEFDNWRVPLPCDFVAFIPGGIAVNGNPVRWATSSFHHLLGGDCCDIDTINNTKMDIFTDNFGNEFSPQSTAVPSDPRMLQDVTFDVVDGYIIFNIKSGKACLAYYSYPVDNEGFLMVPDEAKYKRAITDYVIWKNDYILWRQGALPTDVYKESRDNKNWSIASAASALKMPDDAQLDSMKDTLIRLIPKFNSRTHFYKNMGVQESRRFR